MLSALLTSIRRPDVQWKEFIITNTVRDLKLGHVSDYGPCRIQHNTTQHIPSQYKRVQYNTTKHSTIQHYTPNNNQHSHLRFKIRKYTSSLPVPFSSILLTPDPRDLIGSPKGTESVTACGIEVRHSCTASPRIWLICERVMQSVSKLNRFVPRYVMLYYVTLCSVSLNIVWCVMLWNVLYSGNFNKMHWQDT